MPASDLGGAKGSYAKAKALYLPLAVRREATLRGRPAVALGAARALLKAVEADTGAKADGAGVLPRDKLPANLFKKPEEGGGGGNGWGPGVFASAYVLSSCGKFWFCCCCVRACVCCCCALNVIGRRLLTFALPAACLPLSLSQADAARGVRRGLARARVGPRRGQRRRARCAPVPGHVPPFLSRSSALYFVAVCGRR